MPTLHEAIFNNDLTFVKSLLASSPDLNAADPHSGKTPIQLAIELKRYAILEAIFEYDTTDAINTARMSGQPLLCYAAFKNDFALGKLLLKSGISPDQSAFNQTPLVDAIYNKSERFLKLLIQYGADLELKDSLGRTGLHIAVDHGSREIVKILLDAGANIDVANSKGETIIQTAARQAATSMIELLVHPGEDVDFKDKNGWTILNHAIDAKSSQVVDFLIEQNADPSFQYKYGRTALHQAVLLLRSAPDYFYDYSNAQEKNEAIYRRIGHEAVVRALHQSQERDGNPESRFNRIVCLKNRPSQEILQSFYQIIADTANRANIHGLLNILNAQAFIDDKYYSHTIDYQNETLIQLILYFETMQFIPRESVKEFFRQNSIPDITHIIVESIMRSPKASLALSSIDFRGMTPLHYAAFDHNQAIMKTLLSKPSNLNKQDNYGMTPLHYAVLFGYQEIFDLLLNAQAEVNVSDNRGMTVLHYAVLGNHEKMVNRLLTYPDSINSQDLHGNAALHYAVLQGHSQILASLVTHNASLDLKNKDGYSAVDIAVNEDNEGALFLLTSFDEEDFLEPNPKKKRPN